MPNPLRYATLALALTVALAGAGTARADEAYECRIAQDADNGGWLPEIVVVGRKDGAKTAVVNDPIIDHFIGHPVEAKVETDNSARITFVWEVRTTSRTNQVTRQVYRLTVRKDGLGAQMTSKPLGYEGVYAAEGTCRLARS